jgi:outer membrane protein OmpA-like peptidoglycan-associated protein
MSWWKRLLIPAALGALFALPAQAQVSGRPIEATAGAGISSFDARDFIKDSPVFTGSLGWRWMDFVALEGSFTGARTKMDAPGELDHQWSYTALDLRWTLRDPAEHATPFLLTGVGFGRSLTDGLPIRRAGAPSMGVGFLYNLFGNPRTYLRLQARDILFREQNAREFSHDIAATAALQWSFGGRTKDQDLDGVRNWLDKCPNTPIGAKVDATGCPLDSDKDGVFDGIDKCEGTPAGCKVDAKGCIVDADGDGVCDGLDQCPDTPKGAKVDAKGCPIDTDSDGVWDGLDQCENTPKGCQVDAKGCIVDTDGDGVCDGLDQCPNTPAGLKVDPNGCPIEVSERETELLDTGMIRLQNINFDVNKATIKAESDMLLTEVAKILLQYPALTIEIGGHTDNTGKKEANLKLSEARAQSVLNWITGRYPTVDATHFTVKGYGPTLPVASNATALGKAKNRRVEFKVTNTDVLRIEREKRHFIPKDAAPADSTKH